MKVTIVNDGPDRPTKRPLSAHAWEAILCVNHFEYGSVLRIFGDQNWTCHAFVPPPVLV
ncbi:MAG: hypothetical protein P8P56_07245 [Yoonia sp.]|nr:hypothetical protein [Yoonia sp.]